MDEPNFSEGQLQQLVNTEIFNLLRGVHPDAIPIVIPPWLEEKWGWDTGFWLPWLGRRHSVQKGCNFFIQYKLSTLHDSKYSKGWKHWSKPFFRFNLGYRRKRRWDYSQRDALTRLVASRYRVAYVTNHVLDSVDLFNLATSNRLCSELPVLKAPRTLSRHGYVTFANPGSTFLLHSKKEEAQATHLKTLIESLEQSSLSDDVQALTKIIRSFEEAAGIREGTYQAALDRYSDLNVEKTAAQATLLWVFLRRYLGVFWWRF